MERQMGIEPTFSAWKADVLTDIRLTHVNSFKVSRPRIPFFSQGITLAQTGNVVFATKSPGASDGTRTLNLQVHDIDVLALPSISLALSN